MSERFFNNAVECQEVKVRSNGEVYDPYTGEVFNDLTIAFLEESDDWFEYDESEYRKWAEGL